MLNLNNEIKKSLDEILSSNKFIDTNFKKILKCYIKEKQIFNFGELCILHYRESTNYFDINIYDVAAAIELLILSLDIVDDIQDDDTDYVWMEKPQIALNAVMVMLVNVFRIIRKTQFKYKEQAIDIIEKQLLISINGQYLDIVNKHRDEKSYLNMISQKSGALTAMSCLVGEVLAKGTTSVKLNEYAMYIGMIEQIKNDLNDLIHNIQKRDILTKKITLPIIYILHTRRESDVSKYYNLEIFDINRCFLVDYLKSSGAIRYTLVIKRKLIIKVLNLIHEMKYSKEFEEYMKKIME